MQYLIDQEINIAIELGTGKVLSGLMRRFNKNIKCFLGRGVVISLEALFSEIDDAFEFIGDLKDRLVVSNAACLIQPYHKKIDQLRERSRSGTKIGTTGRGIGPAYEDRVGRRSIRVADLYDPNALKVKLEEALDIYNFLIKRHDEDQQEDLNELLDKNLKQAERLKPFVGNVIAELKAFQESNKTILFEGAQGALLDYSLGTYPFVTSSNSSLGGIASGAGVSATSIDYSLGICKAYTTRVGEGPFPTELNDEIGSYLAEKGGEVGATTGRPRRCGWLDAVLLSHTVYLNGINGICLTKIDVLDGLEKIKICSDYSSSLSREDILESLALNDIEPQYIELEGWQEPTAGVQRFEDLNDKAIDFIAKVEELCGAPIVMISTGPRREDAIIRKYPL
jgi:adenylosuccinate synthase